LNQFCCSSPPYFGKQCSHVATLILAEWSLTI
jgi:hypothetical protein